MMHTIKTLLFFLATINHHYFQASNPTFYSCNSGRNATSTPAPLDKKSKFFKHCNTVDHEIQTTEEESFIAMIWQCQRNIAHQNPDIEIIHFRFIAEQYALLQYLQFVEQTRITQAEVEQYSALNFRRIIERARIENTQEKTEWSDVSDDEIDRSGKPGWDKVHPQESVLTCPNFFTYETPLEKLTKRTTRFAAKTTETINNLAEQTSAWWTDHSQKFLK